MGILILGAVCGVGELFLIYFLVQLVRDSRRDSGKLRSQAKGEKARTQRFVRIQMSPPTEKAAWSEGRWVWSAPEDEAERDNYWRAAHRA